MAKIRHEIRLGHRANLGEEVEAVCFAPGEEVTVLQVWEDRVLCRNHAGQLFNVPKDCLEEI